MDLLSLQNVVATVPDEDLAASAKSLKLKAPRWIASTIRGAALLPKTSEAILKAFVSLVEFCIALTVSFNPSVKDFPSLA